MIPTHITATDLRSRLFDVLNLTREGKEFIVSKDGMPAAKIVPYTPEHSPQEVKRVLRNFKKAFANVKREKYWSVFDTPEWKEKDAKYLEELRKPR